LRMQPLALAESGGCAAQGEGDHPPCTSEERKGGDTP
jgi:hypothetical protein